jgi:hypothetical protein
VWTIEKFGLGATELQQILLVTRFDAYTIYLVGTKASVFWGKMA